MSQWIHYINNKLTMWEVTILPFKIVTVGWDYQKSSQKKKEKMSNKVMTSLLQLCYNTNM